MFGTASVSPVTNVAGLPFSDAERRIAASSVTFADLLEIPRQSVQGARLSQRGAHRGDHPDPSPSSCRGEEFDLTDLRESAAESRKRSRVIGTGSCPAQQLSRRCHPAYSLLRIPGSAPKRVKLFHEKLKVKQRPRFKDALEQGKVAKLPGIGPSCWKRFAKASPTPRRRRRNAWCCTKPSSTRARSWST